MVIELDRLLTPEIMKPARYLGNELGAHHQSWEKATVRWVLSYPEVYEVGASNLGHIILYNILNAQPEQLCDRAYLPAPDLAKKLRETQTPLWGLEARRPLQDYDIIGFNLSYELGATNILEMLDLAGIPLTWKERQHYPNLPLIFAGGQTVTSNPEPFADFFDFFALGDGEELLPEIGEVVAIGKRTGLGKETILLKLAQQVKGVYVPQFYSITEAGAVYPQREDIPPKIVRRVAVPMPEYSIGLVPLVETVHDRLTVEIRRGCTRGCRFCQPGMLTRPARDVEPEKVVKTIVEGMQKTGHNEFSLLSLSCSDYLSLPAVGMEIKNRLKDENITLSLPSQRVDRFDENIANIIGGTRPTGLTFAPEAGSQRLRDVINKGLTNEELLRGIKTAVEQGWDRVKLYFMIGLPGETDHDILAIAETLRWLRRECILPQRKRLEFHVTISNFTPKPHTPFQWHSVSTAEFIRKQALLRDEMRGMRGVKVNFTDVRFSAMEEFLGRGDRRLAPVIRRAWKLGAGMDGWMENVEQAFIAWEEAIEQEGFTWKYRQIETGEWNVIETNNERLESEKKRPQYSWDERLKAVLPWDHINTGIDKEWLKADLQRALEAATVPDCAYEGCSQCGVCGVDFGQNIVIEPPPIPPFQGHFKANQARVQRLRVTFGKVGEMRFVSHLDLVRLFERVARRASFPIAFNGGYHPSPRISIASALSLGMTSQGEIIDFELTKAIDAKEFGEKLREQLPPEIPVYQVEEVPVNSPAATSLLEKAEYHLEIESATALNWQQWLDEVLYRGEILFEKTTKSGKKQLINLRERLFELELIEMVNPETIKLRYLGSYRNDGTVLHPEQVVYMLEQVAGSEMELRSCDRQQLILKLF